MRRSAVLLSCWWWCCSSLFFFHERVLHGMALPLVFPSCFASSLYPTLKAFVFEAVR